VTEDWDGDGHMRASDLCVIPKHLSAQVPYGDALLAILANLLLRCGVPPFEMLPPLDGERPDFLCYWGGDDEFLHNQCEASRFMAEHGLPYHINVLYVDRQRDDPAASMTRKPVSLNSSHGRGQSVSMLPRTAYSPSRTFILPSVSRNRGRASRVLTALPVNTMRSGSSALTMGGSPCSLRTFVSQRRSHTCTTRRRTSPSLSVTMGMVFTSRRYGSAK